MDVKRVVGELDGSGRGGGRRGGQAATVSEMSLGIRAPTVHLLVVAGVAQQGASELTVIADFNFDGHPTSREADCNRRCGGRDSGAAVTKTANGFVAPTRKGAVKDGTGGGFTDGKGRRAVGVILVKQVDGIILVGHDNRVFAHQAHAIHGDGTDLSAHVRGAHNGHVRVIRLSVMLAHGSVLSHDHGRTGHRTPYFRDAQPVFHQPER